MNRIITKIRNGVLWIEYKGIYKAGAVAAFIAALLFRRNLDAEWLLLRGSGIIHSGPPAPPDTVSGWFALLRQSPLLGLTLLNLFDLVNYALVGLIFLALFLALGRASKIWMIIAIALGFTGINIYFASNQAFNMLSLSKQYSAGTSVMEREMLLAAGQAALVIHHNASYAGCGIYLSFLCISAAGLIISVVMLKGTIFGKSTAFFGILANVFGLGYYIAIILAPEFVYVPLSVSAVFLLVWYLKIGSRLWSLGSRRMAATSWASISGKMVVSDL